MNGFLMRLVQRGAGLPTAVAPPSRRAAAESIESGASASQEVVNGGTNNVAAAGATTPLPTMSPNGGEARHEIPAAIGNDSGRPSEVAPPKVGHFGPVKDDAFSRAEARTSARTAEALPIDQARTPVPTSMRRESASTGVTASGFGTEAVHEGLAPPRTARAASRRAAAAASTDGSADENAIATPTSVSESLAAAPAALEEVTQRLNEAATSPASEAARKESLGHLRKPAAEPAIVRPPSPQSMQRDDESEGDQVEVHIGRIEVKVAPPPPVRPQPVRRSTGFDRYRSVRRYAGRNWY